METPQALHFKNASGVWNIKRGITQAKKQVNMFSLSSGFSTFCTLTAGPAAVLLRHRHRHPLPFWLPSYRIPRPSSGLQVSGMGKVLGQFGSVFVQPFPILSLQGSGHLLVQLQSLPVQSFPRTCLAEKGVCEAVTNSSYLGSLFQHR